LIEAQCLVIEKRSRSMKCKVSSLLKQFMMT
jgi:hypothetical protein